MSVVGLVKSHGRGHRNRFALAGVIIGGIGVLIDALAAVALVAAQVAAQSRAQRF